jgi:hypothetical protein
MVVSAAHRQNWQRQLAEQRTELQVERTKLILLVESLAALQCAWDVPEGSQERCDAAALRLQGFSTGIERCLGQIICLLKDDLPDGAAWNRHLDADTATGLAELMRFRHVVWHGYAQELEPEQVHGLLGRGLKLWPAVEQHLVAFDAWLQELQA